MSEISFETTHTPTESIEAIIRSQGTEANGGKVKVILRASSTNNPVFNNTNGSQSVGVGLPKVDSDGRFDLKAARISGTATTGTHRIPDAAVSEINSLPQNEAGFVFKKDGNPYVIRVSIWSSNGVDRLQFEN